MLQVFLSLPIGIGMSASHLFLPFSFLAEQSSSLKRACFACRTFKTKILILQPRPLLRKIVCVYIYMHICTHPLFFNFLTWQIEEGSVLQSPIHGSQMQVLNCSVVVAMLWTSIMKGNGWGEQNRNKVRYIGKAEAGG